MTTPNLSSFMTPFPRSTSVSRYFAADVVPFVQKLVDSYSKWGYNCNFSLSCILILSLPSLTPSLPSSSSLPLPSSLLCLSSPKLRISFITFDDPQDVFVKLPLTSNRAQMQAAIELLKNITPIGRTHLGPAISRVKFHYAQSTTVCVTCIHWGVHSE